MPTVKILTVPPVTQSNGQPTCVTPSTFFEPCDSDPQTHDEHPRINSDLFEYLGTTRAATAAPYKIPLNASVRFEEISLSTPFIYPPSWGATEELADMHLRYIPNRSERFSNAFSTKPSSQGQASAFSARKPGSSARWPAEMRRYTSQAHVNWMGKDPGYLMRYPDLAPCHTIGPKRDSRNDSTAGPVLANPAEGLTASTAVTIDGKGCFRPGACPTTDSQPSPPPAVSSDPESALETVHRLNPMPESISVSKSSPQPAPDSTTKSAFEALLPEQHITELPDSNSPPMISPSYRSLDVVDEVVSSPTSTQGLGALIFEAFFGGPKGIRSLAPSTTRGGISSSVADQIIIPATISSVVPQPTYNLNAASSVAVVSGVANPLQKEGSIEPDALSTTVPLELQPFLSNAASQTIPASQRFIPGVAALSFTVPAYSSASLRSVIIMNDETTPFHNQQDSIVTNANSDPITTISSKLYNVDTVSRYVFGSQTIIPGGPPISISGNPVLIASSDSVVVVAGTSIPFGSGGTLIFIIGSYTAGDTPLPEHNIGTSALASGASAVKGSSAVKSHASPEGGMMMNGTSTSQINYPTSVNGSAAVGFTARGGRVEVGVVSRALGLCLGFFGLFIA
ncbi:MAG: hypothetical protein Q9164_006477 [Protoblastenia rupestris]